MVQFENLTFLLLLFFVIDILLFFLFFYFVSFTFWWASNTDVKLSNLLDLIVFKFFESTVAGLSRAKADSICDYNGNNLRYDRTKPCR